MTISRFGVDSAGVAALPSRKSTRMSLRASGRSRKWDGQWEGAAGRVGGPRYQRGLICPISPMPIRIYHSGEDKLFRWDHHGRSPYLRLVAGGDRFRPPRLRCHDYFVHHTFR
jgi:hypothetical protein